MTARIYRASVKETHLSRGDDTLEVVISRLREAAKLCEWEGVPAEAGAGRGGLRGCWRAGLVVAALRGQPQSRRVGKPRRSVA